MKIRVITVDEKEKEYGVCDATLKEIAEKYFSNPEVVRVEFLDPVEVKETEYCKLTTLNLYRVPQEEVEEFQLWYNIRKSVRIEYKNPLPSGETVVDTSCGFMNI